VAKKQASKPQPTPDSSPPAGQLSIINLKGSQALKDWLSARTKQTHIPAASIVRLGLACWAEQNGHPAPPER
jgi:hypothetical protein